jgi:type I restriction enzyme M protein
VKDLTIRAKWLARLDGDVQAEVARVSQTLTGRVRVLAERYATPLPQLEADAATLAARVADHLRAMGLAW